MQRLQRGVDDIEEKEEIDFVRRIVCVLNMTGRPSKRIHTYRPRLRPLNAFIFLLSVEKEWEWDWDSIDRGVVVVGVE